jgi:hypothetical protein
LEAGIILARCGWMLKLAFAGRESSPSYGSAEVGTMVGTVAGSVYLLVRIVQGRLMNVNIYGQRAYV